MDKNIATTHLSKEDPFNCVIQKKDIRSNTFIPEKKSQCKMTNEIGSTKPKRAALIACYLVEARNTLLDQIVEMNDLFLTAMNRKTRTAVEKRRKSMRRRARDGLHRVLGGVDALAKADGAQTVGAFREEVNAPALVEVNAPALVEVNAPALVEVNAPALVEVNAPALVEAADACRAYERLEERGHLDAMLSRYGTLRRYLPGFLALPFQAVAGSEPLIQAIEILRAADAGTRGPLTPDDPHGFVQADWRPYLIEDGKLDRHIWEISLAFAVRDALRAGGLFLAQSRDHVSFWSLVHDDRSWQASRAQAYRQLGLPTDPQSFLAKIMASFDQAARAAADGLARNRFAAVRNGRLKLKRTDALPISRELRQLREAFQASYPRVRIEDLLQDVDEWCGFTRAFQPLAGYQSRAKDHHRSLLATLIAHGTNLGLAAMSQSVDTITAEALQPHLGHQLDTQKTRAIPAPAPTRRS